VIVAFFAHKKRFWLKIYALAAISLLIVALAIHLIGFQQLPLIELSPLMLCLMYIYIDMYKQNVHAPASGSTAQPQT
jgi:FtsH-binding integral membrane protein